MKRDTNPSKRIKNLNGRLCDVNCGKDAGTYAWDEDWGDWVGAGMDDMGLNVGWDDMGPYEDPLPSSVQGRGAGGSQMYPQPSAGLS